MYLEDFPGSYFHNQMNEKITIEMIRFLAAEKMIKNLDSEYGFFLVAHLFNDNKFKVVRQTLNWR